jgi:hypothetical protein
VLLNKFKDFLSADLTTIAKFDTFEIPDGIQLFDPESETEHIAQDILDMDFEEPNVTSEKI